MKIEAKTLPFGGRLRAAGQNPLVRSTAYPTDLSMQNTGRRT